MAPEVDPRPAGIVLAGGAGRRMGAQKAAAPFAGTTLAAHAAGLLAPHCREVVVVARDETAVPAVPARVVRDRPGPHAAMTGIATGLAAVGAADVLVVACDLPLCGPLLARLAACPPGVTAAARDEAGRLQALCARYPRERALEAAERLLARESLALRGLLDELGAVPVDAHGDELLNANDPGALRRAEDALAGR